MALKHLTVEKCHLIHVLKKKGLWYLTCCVCKKKNTEICDSASNTRWSAPTTLIILSAECNRGLLKAGKWGFLTAAQPLTQLPHHPTVCSEPSVSPGHVLCVRMWTLQLQNFLQKSHSSFFYQQRTILACCRVGKMQMEQVWDSQRVDWIEH